MMRVTAALVLSSVMPAAMAASVVTQECQAPISSGLVCATGIEGFQYDGHTYNVQFLWGSFSDIGESLVTPFETENEARQGVAQMNVLLYHSAVYRLDDPAIDSADFGEFNVIYGPDQPLTEVGDEIGVVSGFTNDQFHWTQESSEARFWVPELYASFFPVPIPPSAWLFASAIGLLGWFRQRNPL